MKTHRIIQVISDISDVSYNEMYAVMQSIAQSMSKKLIDIAPLASVKELSITHGAFITRLLTKHFSCPAVIFTNVAPHPIFKDDLICKLKDRDIIYIGSNNGIFGWLANDFEFEYLIRVKKLYPFIVDGKIIYLPGQNPPKDIEKILNTNPAYKTFSAHVIYGAIATALALDVDYKKFGDNISKDKIVPLNIKNGEIVHIDNYGNVKIYGALTSKIGAHIEVYLKNKCIAEAKYINDRMMSHDTDSFVLYPSTSPPGMVDLAMVRNNAAAHLGLNINDVLSFKTVSRASK